MVQDLARNVNAVPRQGHGVLDHCKNVSPCVFLLFGTSFFWHPHHLALPYNIETGVWNRAEPESLSFGGPFVVQPS